MEVKNLVETINRIEMSKEMEDRIIQNCYVQMEESIMSKKNKRCVFKNPMVTAASLVMCLFLTGVTALAVTGKLEGFFKDVIRWDGAVTGTTYEDATDEICIHVYSEIDDQLTVVVELVDSMMIPYSALEQMGMLSYEIIDKSGKIVHKGKEKELFDISEGSISMNISLMDIPEGNYKLKISEIVGSKKADQPLSIHGNWECEFVR